MRSRIVATVSWLRGRRWLLPAGTLLTLLTAGVVGAIPILLAPSAGWRWVAVFASPTVGFITVVVMMELVHRVRRVLIAHQLLNEPEVPSTARSEEEEALITAMHDPREPDGTRLGGRQASSARAVFFAPM